MSGSSFDEMIQFRAGPEKKAAEHLDEIHVGGINMSELARVGLVEMLRRTLDEQDEIEIYERYSRGEIDEETARVLLGETVDHVEAELEAFESAMDRDSASFLAE